MDRIRALIKRIAEWLRRVVVEPRNELTRWQRAARFAYDLGGVGARQLRQVRAGQMAAALSFRTLFGMIPVLVVGMLIVRSFSSTEEWTQRLADVLGNVGLNDIVVTAAGAANGSGPSEGQNLSDWLLSLVSQLEQINFAAIGWAGVLVIIYSAIGLMVTIEKSFNVIYQAPEGRSWTRRVPIYWTVLTFGPLAIALATVLSAKVQTWMQGQAIWTPLLETAASLWSFAVIWLVIFAVYKLVPNTNVAARPAAIGAGIAAVLVEIGKLTLGAYFHNAVSFSQLLGSLGLVPVFMFWLYVMWLIILFGLEVGNTLQMLGSRRLEEMESSRQALGLVEPASVLALMELVAGRFATAKSVTPREIAEHTGLPEVTIQNLLDRLCQAGFVNRLDRESTVYLARPPDQITGDQLMEIGFRLADEAAGERSSLLARLRQAQRSLAAQTTLASLVRPAPAGPAGDQ